MFIGEYRHTVDEKGRIAVPVRFRALLTEGAVVSRWLDAAGAIFTPDEFDRVMDKARALPISDSDARRFERFMSSGAFPLELDKQGRFVIPPLVREWAGLAGEVVIVGTRNHVELWEPGRWAEYSAEMASADVLAEHLQRLGI